MTDNTTIRENPVKSGANTSYKIQQIAISAVFIALTFVFTGFVNIRLPIMGNGGLIHLGNIPLFVAATVFGWKVGMLAGGLGMTLFDVTSGWTAWAPYTLITVGLMGFVVGKISHGKDGYANSYIRNAIAFVAALVIKIVGMYIAELIMTHSFVTPLGSIPGNVLQVSVAAVIVFPFVVRLRKEADRIFNK